MVKIGVNLNNREPLITDEYTVDDMFNMGVQAEELGYDSVWIGDNLLERPRLEPVSILGSLAGLTDRVSLGTACMITTLRNPVQFAQAWATLDQISDGRMILGACMGTPNPLNRKQHEVVGVPPAKRALALEEGLEVMKALWEDGEVNYSGEYFEFEDVSFDTGEEINPLSPVQDEVEIMVVSNPSLHGKEAVVDRAIRRIVDIGNGWMSCCRADRPDEYETQYDAIVDYAEDQGVDPSDISTSYQVTLHIADSSDEAEEAMHDYISSYYPAMYDPDDIESWGPMGTAEDIVDWIEDFNNRGCGHFIVRFGAFDQKSQMERFSNEVLPLL